MTLYMTVNLLLALVPLSCMVVPKRVVANKFFTIPSAFPSNTSIFTLPSIKEIDINDNSITRGRTTSYCGNHLSQGQMITQVSRSLMVDFSLFSLFIFILLFFSFLFPFSIFRTTQVRVYQSRCHISHKLMA